VNSPHDPWSLLRHHSIDAMTLLRSIASPPFLQSTDPRSQLLGRDSLRALESFWGASIFRRRLSLIGADQLADRFRIAESEGTFHTLKQRVMETTDPENILRMLRRLGSRMRTPATLVLGRSTPLLLDAILVRKTDDVDVVDEVPEPLRNDHALIQEMIDEFGLRLTHFQSHYLPSGWKARVRSLGVFGRLTVHQVDSLDILVTKLFSRRVKDQRDLNEAWGLIDREKFMGRLAGDTSSLRSDERSLEAAQQNWYVLTGDADLPAPPP